MTTSFRKTAIKLAGILAIGLFGIVLILYFKLAVTFLSFFESMETDSPESKSAFVLKRHENQVITDVRQLLFQQFSDLLREPEAYRKLIRQECHIFPEGELFGYVLPLFSYAHITLENPRLRDFALSKSADLISLAIPEVERQVSPPGGRLENLRDFNDQATYLGQFNMALGYYRMLGGDGRFDKIHKAVSEALFRALLKNNAFPLNSYPEHSWTFDTVPCLVSLRLCDKATGSKRYESVIKEHLKWMREKGTEPETGLPYSAVSESGKQKIVVAPPGMRHFMENRPAEPVGCRLFPLIVQKLHCPFLEGAVLSLRIFRVVGICRGRSRHRLGTDHNGCGTCRDQFGNRNGSAHG